MTTGGPGQETSGIRAAYMRSAASVHCAATVTGQHHLEEHHGENLSRPDADGTLPHQRVSAAVEQVEAEASVELEESLV